MFTTIEETLDWIQTHLPHGIKPGLSRMEWVMAQLGNPERNIRAIHVGGTNGKGSTVSFLRSILMEQYEDVGTFTSPYIVNFNERISVNNRPISDEDLIKAANLIYPLAQQLGDSELGYPTEFEVITMISLVYFSRIHPCDIVIYEVGLGGRLDSTNVIKPLISVITNVGHDHMAILGNSIKEIAFEKAGIIKPGVPIVTTVEHPEAIEVIQNKAKEVNAKLYLFGKDFNAESEALDDPRFEGFSFKSTYWNYKGLKSALRGPHQIKNAAAALKTLEVLNVFYALIVDENAIYSGLEKVEWPGRFEEISQEPRIILDGAHNEEGIHALIETMKQKYADKSVHVLFATLKDRENESIIKQVSEISRRITFTSFDFHRAERAENLLEFNPSGRVEPDWRKAISDLKNQLKKDDILLITGSLYFISEVRRFLTVI